MSTAAEMNGRQTRPVSNYNAANLVTAGRLVLALAIGVMLWRLEWSQPCRWILWGVFVIAMALDVVDGLLARKHHLITNFGKWFDPFVDKVTVIVALVGLSLHHQVWWLVTIVVVSREICVDTLRHLAWWRWQAAMPATQLAKLKTICQAVAIALCLAPLEYWPANWAVTGLRWLALIVAVVLTLVTWFQYIRQFGARVREKR